MVKKQFADAFNIKKESVASVQSIETQHPSNGYSTFPGHAWKPFIFALQKIKRW